MLIRFTCRLSIRLLRKKTHVTHLLQTGFSCVFGCGYLSITGIPGTYLLQLCRTTPAEIRQSRQIGSDCQAVAEQKFLSGRTSEVIA